MALVTGASSGIGRALALRLARGGCRVGLVARREEALREVAAEIGGPADGTVVAPCDVTDAAGVARATQAVANRLGPLDLVIANAGVGGRTPVEAFDAGRVEWIYRVNVLGAVNTIAAALPAMLSRGRGQIAGISSLSAYSASALHSPYAASKAALNTQLEGLRLGLAPRGIHVTTVCPGFIRTPMTAGNRRPMPFLLEADEAARRILRAVERRRRVYDFPWQTALLLRTVRALPAALSERLRAVVH